MGCHEELLRPRISTKTVVNRGVRLRFERAPLGERPGLRVIINQEELNNVGLAAG